MSGRGRGENGNPAEGAEKRRANRGAFPVHLPRIDVIEPESRVCPCCRSPMHRIGPDVQRLDVVPRSFAAVSPRPKYACRACEEAVVQAPAPERLIKGGLPTEAMVASVLVLNTPGICRSIVRPRCWPPRASTSSARRWLLGWLPAAELRPVFERLRELILMSGKIAVDETKAPVLDPGRGRVKEGYFWAVARDLAMGRGDPPASPSPMHPAAGRSTA